jgi:hypothetical protein
LGQIIELYPKFSQRIETTQWMLSPILKTKPALSKAASGSIGNWGIEHHNLFDSWRL